MSSRIGGIAAPQVSFHCSKKPAKIQNSQLRIKTITKTRALIGPSVLAGKKSKQISEKQSFFWNSFFFVCFLGCHLSTTSWARLLAICDNGRICHMWRNPLFTVTRDFGSTVAGNFRPSRTAKGQRQRLFPVLVKGQAGGQNAPKNRKRSQIKVVLPDPADSRL